MSPEEIEKIMGMADESEKGSRGNSPVVSEGVDQKADDHLEDPKNIGDQAA